MRILQRNLKRTTDTFLFISHTTKRLLFKFRCNIFIGVRIIKESPGSVASGTPYILLTTPTRLYLIYFLTAIELTPGGCSTVHIYTQIHRRAQLTGKSADRAPSLRVILWHLPYN